MDEKLLDKINILIAKLKINAEIGLNNARLYLKIDDSIYILKENISLKKMGKNILDYRYNIVGCPLVFLCCIQDYIEMKLI